MNENGSEFSIDLLRKGDQAEFTRLVEAYSVQIYRLAIRMLATPADAEDVLQNTFLKAFQHMEGFEGRSSLSTWLYRIASNEALMLLRKRRPEVELDDTGSQEDFMREYTPLQLADWGPLPEEVYLSAESKDILDKAVQLLPASLRIVFILRDLQDLSIQETAETLDLSEGAVKTRLLRARLRLRETLGTYFGNQLEIRQNKE